MRKWNRSLVILLISGLVSSYAVGQTTVKSRESQINKQNDSLRIIDLISQSEKYQYKDFNKSVQLSNQAIDIATNKGWNWAIALAYTRRTYLSSLGGDFISALSYDQDLLKLSVSLKDSAQIADCLNFLGFDYQELGEFDEAYYYFSQTLRISISINDSTKIARAYINVASVLKELGQYEDALNYLDRSRQIAKKTSNSSSVPYILDEIGDVLQRQNQLEKAEATLLQSLKLTREMNQLILEPEVFQKLGEVFNKQGDFEKANMYYDSALASYAKSNNIFGTAQIKLGYGKVYLKQMKLDSAKLMIEESRTLAHQLNAKKAEADCLTALGELAELKKDFEKALAYYKLSSQISDSLVSRETLTKTFQNQLRFETENRDLEIAELTAFKKKQIKTNKQEELIRNILVVSMALTAAVLLTVYRSGQRRLKINKLLLEHQEEIKHRAIELEQLNKVKDKFFSIISHDLRSPMNSLSAILKLMEGKGLTADEFGRLSKELRLQFSNTKTLINNLLDWALMQMDKLKTQPEQINLRTIATENYNLLSSLHLKEITFVNLINEAHHGYADANMINLVFRNLIMNAIKFTDNGGIITSDSIERDNHFEICITDNGVGMDDEVKKLIFEKTIGYSTRGTANEKGTGLGLILCKEFVERNGGTIWVESQLGVGSKFYFTVQKPPVVS
jgi:signal transduction histidine kinase